MRFFLSWPAALLFLLPAIAPAQTVSTYHHSANRHGVYTVPGLTLEAAASLHPDTNFHAGVEGHVYAQPLYWLPAGTRKGQLIVATESNDVYALDAATGAQIWKTALGPSVPLSALPCGNIDPDGITGTPVIDPKAGIVYLDALVAKKAGPRHLIYAVSLADGSVLSGWPLDVQAALGKAGVNFSSSTQGERSALTLLDGALYVNFGGNWGDCGSYRGTVLEVDTSSARLVAHWSTKANGGGIWAQGGIASDGGSLFVTTGNTFGAHKWSGGEGIIRLKPGLANPTSPKDYFAPSNWQQLDASDEDLGGTEALPLNVPVAGASPAKRVIAFGKDGNAYLVNRDNLGGIGGQLALQHVSTGAIITAPAIFQSAAGAMVAITSRGGGSCSGNNLTMLTITASQQNPITTAWCAPFRGAGAPVVTTSDGKADPIVWVAGAEGDDMLHGFNALNGHAVFAGTSTKMAGLHHFVTVMAAQKHLYVAADDTVYAFVFNAAD